MKFSSGILLMLILVSFMLSQTQVEVTMSQGIEGYTLDLAWNADGSRLADARSSGSIHILDAAGNLVERFDFPIVPNSVSWNPTHNDQLVFGDYRGRLHILDVSAGHLIWTSPSDEVIIDVAWSPDGTRIVSAGTISSGLAGNHSVRIWNAGTSNRAVTSIYLGVPVSKLAWNPQNSNEIAASVSEGLIFVWDVTTGNEILRWELEDHNVLGIAWNSLGTQLAYPFSAISGIRGVEIRDVASGQVIQRIETENSLAVAWSPSQYLAYSDRGSAHVFDVEHSEIVASYPRGTVSALGWSTTGLLAYGKALPDHPIEIIIPIANANNQTPTASANTDQTVTDSDGNGFAQVALDASASSDPDGTIVSYEWFAGDTLIASGVNPTVELAVGVHPLTLTVTDDEGASASDEVVITVRSTVE